MGKRIVLEAVIIKQPQCPSTKLDISMDESERQSDLIYPEGKN